jgi:hypothetical protein
MRERRIKELEGLKAQVRHADCPGRATRLAPVPVAISINSPHAPSQAQDLHGANAALADEKERLRQHLSYLEGRFAKLIGENIKLGGALLAVTKTSRGASGGEQQQLPQQLQAQRQRSGSPVGGGQSLVRCIDWCAGVWRDAWLLLSFCTAGGAGEMLPRASCRGG